MMYEWHLTLSKTRMLDVSRSLRFAAAPTKISRASRNRKTITEEMKNYMYSVINLILPNSKQLLWHFFTNKQVDVLGDFNLEFWYILLFEVRFWIFRISFFAQNGDNSKGYPLENLKSHHLWFEKCFLITKCIKISVIKIISKLT